MRKTAFIILFALGVVPVFAQRTLWNNALIFIGDSSLVYVNGDAENHGSTAEVINHGELDLNNSASNGDYFLANNSVTRGNGTYRLEGDWVNNAIFIADSSHVHVDGDNQLITGSVETTFFKLETENTGVKTLTLNAYVLQQLLLNDRELAASDFLITVKNTDTVSVQNNLIVGAEGFISSTNTGGLVRHMDTTLTYRFPVGDDNGVRRYREYRLRPNVLGYQVFRVGMRHYTATLDGWDVALKDSTLCKVNPLFYHRVTRDSGLALANDVTMHWLPAADGNFTTNAQWQPAALWSDIGNPIQQMSTYGRITSTNHTDFNQEAFALALITPAPPTIFGDTIVCDSTQWLSYYHPFAPGTTYNWTFPQGAGYSGTGAVVQVNWSGTGGGGQLGLQTTDIEGCVSFPSWITVNTSGLNAAFDTLSLPFAATYEFLNASVGAANYEWIFGDGNQSTDTNPIHTYGALGGYMVYLVATDPLGCIDTAQITILVEPDIFIPNIITPNGDLTNDFLQIQALGIEDFTLTIQNRWGLEVFQSSRWDLMWDGTNLFNGQPLSTGTYFYVFTAKVGTKDYIRKGFVTLVR